MIRTVKGKKHTLICLLCVAVFVSGCGQKHKEGEPDVISSIKMNQDEMLTVVANRNQIENKEEFAKLLIQMCKENSFHTIKFSTDRGYATSLHMRVYLWRDKIEGYDPVMTVEFEPAEYGQGYDIVHDSEQFDLFVDGKLCE